MGGGGGGLLVQYLSRGEPLRVDPVYRTKEKIHTLFRTKDMDIIHHFIFAFSLYFFYHSSCRKNQLTVLILKFDMYSV